jgi:hypothetical protein
MEEFEVVGENEETCKRCENENIDAYKKRKVACNKGCPAQS